LYLFIYYRKILFRFLTYSLHVKIAQVVCEIIDIKGGGPVII